MTRRSSSYRPSDYHVRMLTSHQSACLANTSAAPDVVDITTSVEGALEESGIRDGQVTIFCPNDGCAILVNEFEAGLMADLKRTIVRAKSFWPRAAIGVRSVVVPAAEGRLRLGTWQRLLLVELDRPGPREVVVQILGES